MNKALKYVLNTVLGILCAVPVITLADSITAMHFVNFKLADNPEISVTREFFKSFKINLVQSVFFTVIFAGIGYFLGYKWYTELTSGDVSKGVVIILGIATFLFFMFEAISTYILAKFDNPIGKQLLLVVLAIGSHIDCAAKMAFMPIFSIALAVIIVLVNPGVISFTVAMVFLFIAMVINEMLSTKWIMPIYDTLLAIREQGELSAKQAAAGEEETAGQPVADDETSDSNPTNESEDTDNNEE